MAAVLEAKTLPDIFAGERGPERKKGWLKNRYGCVVPR